MNVLEVGANDLLVVCVPAAMTKAETKDFSSAWAEGAGRGAVLLSGDCEFVVVRDGRVAS